MSQVVVLCGGLGTRMASVTGSGQKCMTPVAGRPFLHHVLDRVVSTSVDNLLLLAGHAAESVEAFARTWQHPVTSSPKDGEHQATPHTTVFVESIPSGPIGALRAAIAHLDDEFLLVLGDVLPPQQTDLWQSLSNSLHDTGAQAVMAVAPQTRSHDQGNVRIQGPWITHYDKTIDAPHIDRGVRFLRKETLGYHPGNHDGPFFGSLADRGELAQWHCDQPIVEIGTPDRWKSACSALAAPQPTPPPARQAERSPR